MKKAFITGADGMLGSSICRELLKQGYEVKAMCLPGRNTSTLDGLQIEIVLGDILDKNFMRQELQGCMYIIHVAALTNVWPRRLQILREVNIQGTKNVMEVAEELNITRMVHIGTASSFGHGSKEYPGDESKAFIGWKYGMDYIDSKYIVQQMLLDHHAKTGFPIIIINPTFMIGPYDSGPTSGKMLIELFKGNVQGYSIGGKNFVCSMDVAQAVVNALTKGVPGQCYIAGNENLEYREFFMKACKTLNKKFKLKAIPPLFILLAGALSSFAARITGTPPKFSYGMAVIGNMKHFFSSSKARQELNMPQTPIEVGIEQCMEWFNANGYLK
jgi:dihydroflavonol-4-reductase